MKHAGTRSGAGVHVGVLDTGGNEMSTQGVTQGVIDKRRLQPYD